MKTVRFRDLLVWQRSTELAKNVYRTTHAFPNREAFGLSSQLCRAAVSIPSNIAEGTGDFPTGASLSFSGKREARSMSLKRNWSLPTVWVTLMSWT
jgi:hypothetical protein